MAVFEGRFEEGCEGDCEGDCDESVDESVEKRFDRKAKRTHSAVGLCASHDPGHDSLWRGRLEQSIFNALAAAGFVTSSHAAARRHDCLYYGRVFSR